MNDPILEAAYASILARCPIPTAPESPTMHTYEIRFTYTTSHKGQHVASSDKHTLQADSSADASRAFNAWFEDAYQGATLRSTAILQTPGT